jgi:repressor LexA
MMTVRQKATYDYIRHYTDDHAGVAPSVREIKRALRLTSTSQAVRLLKALTERGKIRRLANRHRAIEILPEPKRFVAYFMWDDEAKELKPWQP